MRYIDSVAYLMRADPAIGTSLISTFSSQPVYRAAIVSRGVVPMLVAALSGAATVDVQRGCVLTLANLAYEEEGARAVLAEGALSVLLALAGGASDEQVGSVSCFFLGFSHHIIIIRSKGCPSCASATWRSFL